MRCEASEEAETTSSQKILIRILRYLQCHIHSMSTLRLILVNVCSLNTKTVKQKKLFQNVFQSVQMCKRQLAVISLTEQMVAFHWKRKKKKHDNHNNGRQLHASVV